MRCRCIAFLFFLAFQSVGIAAPTPIKVSENEAGYLAYINGVQRQIPFVGTSVDRAKEFNNVVSILRQEYPKYESWMKAKPGPYTIEAYQETSAAVQELQLSDAHLASIQFQLQQQYEELQREIPRDLSPSESLKWFKETGFRKLLNVMEVSSEPVSGIFVGLAQLLSGEEKAAFFRIVDPQAKLQFVKAKKFSDEDLRKSTFRPEQVGLTRENVSVEKVLSIVQNRLSRSTQIMLWISFLKATSKLKPGHFSEGGSLSKSADAFSKLLNSTDFDFAYRANSEFVSDITRFLAKSGSKNEAWIQNQIRAFQDDIPRSNFQVSIRNTKDRTISLRVYEVPPHLGIYRGCIGGDCSTTYSAFFPLSPWEHVFYIANAKGDFLGYITATRLKVNGVDSLYVKDLNGSKLSGENAEIALQAIASSISAYGAKKFLIANSAFTNANNQNRPVSKMLNGYIQNGVVQKLDFNDTNIRDFLHSRLRLAGYDLAKTHPDGVQLKTNDFNVIPYKFRTLQGGLPEVDPELLRSEVIRAPRKVILEGQSIRDAAQVLSVSELESLVEAIENKKLRPITEHMKFLKELFSAYGVRLSQSLRNANLDLLASGIFRAPDIMLSAENGWKKFAIDTFYRFVRQGVQTNDTTNFFEAWADEILSQKEFDAVLMEISKRLNLQDIFVLSAFAENGSKVAKSILKSKENRQRILAALDMLVSPENSLNLEAKYPGTDSKIGFDAFSYIIDNPDQFTTGAMKKKFEQFLRNFKLKPDEIKDSKLEVEIENAILRSSNAFRSKLASWYQRINHQVQNNLMSGTQFLKWLADFDTDGGRVRKTVQLRIGELKKKRTDAAVVELYAMFAMGYYDLASSALSSPELHEVNLRVMKAVMRPTFGASDYTPLSKEAYEIFDYLVKYTSENNIDTISLHNLRSELEWKGDTVAETLTHWVELLIGLGYSSWGEVLLTPQSARLAAKNWLSLPDAFSSSNHDSIDMSFYFFLYLIRAGKDETLMWKQFISNALYLKQLHGFNPFVEALRKSFLEEKCDGCGRGLAQLINIGVLDRNYLSGREAILKLLSSTAPEARILGFIRATEGRDLDLISDQILTLVLRDLSKLPMEGSAYAPLLLKEAALLALSHTPLNSKKAMSILLEWMESEPITILAFRILKIYLSNGGDAQKAKKVFAGEFSNPDTAKRYSEEVASIKKLLNQKLAMRFQVIKVVNCSALF